MNLRDITDAIGGDDKPTLRRAFVALVSPSPSQEVEASSPGMLVVALGRVCTALKNDDEPMPKDVCASLAIPVGVTFGAGAAAAKLAWPRLARALIDRAPLVG